MNIYRKIHPTASDFKFFQANSKYCMDCINHNTIQKTSMNVKSCKTVWSYCNNFINKDQKDNHRNNIYIGNLKMPF